MIDHGNIVILTGAGISQESGLATFRDADGIWAKVRIEDVATPEAYARDPDRVHRFYNARRRPLAERDVAPNVAHLALARLEADWPGEVLIVTQNIDDLHERAGSQNLIHMHGELTKARCTSCGDVRRQVEDLNAGSICPACQTGGTLRPHIVWFGELPFEQERTTQALDDCALFISIGTSGSVYPAAGFVHELEIAGRAHTVELNLEPSLGGSLYAESHYGLASRIVPEFVARILSGDLNLSAS